MRSLFLSAIATAVFTSFTADAAPAPKSTLYVFGDSLSDVGAVRALTLGIVPSKPYWEGRFSSGPAWNEYLSLLLNYNLHNRAYGGATSDNSFVPSLPTGNFIQIPSTKDQINYFKLAQPFYPMYAHKYNDIVALAIGHNDYFQATPALLSGELSVPAFATELADIVLKQIEELKDFGFEKIILSNMAAIHLTPMAAAEGTVDLATEVVTTYNKQLAERSGEWAKTAGLEFFYMVDLAKFVEITLRPSITDLLGLTDVHTECYTGPLVSFDPSDDLCDNPSTRYFFDNIHPAERIQRLFGYYGYKMYTAVSNGGDYELTEENLISIIKEYNLGTPAPKPAQI